MQIIEPSGWRTQPWRNGAGVTHEVVRWPDDDSFVIRISVADVTAPAPFSTFPGVHRWLYLLAGGPVTLAIEGNAATLAAPGDGVDFDGEARVAATIVASRSRDLNFMVRADRRTRAEIVRGDASRDLAGRAVAVFAIAGEVSVSGTLLSPSACAWALGDLRLEVRGAAAIAAVLAVG